MLRARVRLGLRYDALSQLPAFLQTLTTAVDVTLGLFRVWNLIPSGGLGGQMASKEDQETLRILVQHVARAFYEPKYTIIMDQLSRHPV